MARSSARPPKIILKEFDRAWDDKRDWEPLYREAYEFALPQRNPYYQGDGSGQKLPGGQRKADRVFDSTLPNATVKLANRIQTELCPPGRIWATMKPGVFIGEEVKEQAKLELHAIGQALFAALHLSNFDQSINEWFLELITPGTAVMAVMEGSTPESPIDFVCMPQSQVALREGPNGRIWGMYRKHRLMIRLIEEQWKDAKVPERLAVTAEDDRDPAAEVDLCEALYFDPKAKSWCYDVIWRDGDGERLVERDYTDGYWVVTRWLKASGETHGRGLVIAALPDAKTLNKMKELMLMNASIAVKGVYLVNNNAVLNAANVSIRPGVNIPVRNGSGGQPAISRLETGGDLRFAEALMGDLRDAINMTMLNRALPQETAGVRSATEIVERLKEIQMDLGSPLGRVITEGLIPMMQLALGVLGRAGIVPRPNNRAIPLDGGQVKFEISSPLVQSQNLADVEAVTQWVSLQMQLLGKEATILGTKIEDVPEYLAEKMNVAPRLVRPKAERGDFMKVVGTLMGQAAAPVAANAQGGGVAAPGAALPLAA